MIDDAAPKMKIRQYARGALTVAGVGDVSLVPVDQVAAAVGLEQGDLYELGQDAPRSIREIIKKLRGNVLGFLAIDERKYFVDRGMSVPRQRFTAGHEIGHDALPWHRAAFWGDDDTTLSLATKELLEIEANQFAVELLSGAGRFTKQADAYAPGLDVALDLASEYGLSVHSAIRKYIEDSKHPVAVLTLGRYPSQRGGLKRIDAQTFESRAFAERWGRIASLVPASIDATTYPEVNAFLAKQTGSVPRCDVKLTTKRGAVTFAAEGFTNGRLNFIVVHREGRFSGQKLRLVSSDGRGPLLPS